MNSLINNAPNRIYMKPLYIFDDEKSFEFIFCVNRISIPSVLLPQAMI